MGRARYTLNQIAHANKRAGFYFFSKATMEWWHNTMNDFHVRTEDDGATYVINARGGSVWRFNPGNGALHPTNRRAEEFGIDVISDDQ